MSVIADVSSEEESRGSAPSIKSLSKGLIALDVLRQTGELRTSTLASRLSVDKGSASRILATLAQAGYASRTNSRSYGRGPKLEDNAPASRPPQRIRERAAPLLARLAEETVESVYLGVLVDDQVLYLDKKIPEVTLLVERPIPTLSPVYCTAIGKVFMAFAGAPPPAVMPALTKKTITDPRHLQEELERARANGFASDDEELNIGVRCVAAPLIDIGGLVVGAISVAIPSVRIESHEIEAMGRRVMQIARTFPQLSNSIKS